MVSLKRKSEDINIADLSNNLLNCSISMTNKDAIIYCRTAQKNNLSEQIQVLELYCNTNDYTIKDCICDNNSAYNNFELLSIHDMLDKYKNINLIVSEPSRLARNIIDGANIIKKCIENNIVIHVVDNNYVVNNSTEYKRLLCGFFDAMTEMETLIKRQKLHNTIQKKLGAHFGAVPFGYELYSVSVDNIMVRKIKKLPEEHNESKIIKLIECMYYGNNNINNNNKDFYELFNSLHDFPEKLGTSYKFTDYKNKEYTNADFAKGFTVGSIVGLLNDWNIIKRGKMWSKSSLLSVISNTTENEMIL
jgi:DNA invertase Pin-like site-specific DNA recombinase